MALVLYADAYWMSPYVFSVYVALVEKGVPFEIRAFDLYAGEQWDPAFAGPSLTGKVPAIEHDGFWLTESLAIALYLEETFPEPALFPAERRERARALQVMSWLRSDLLPLREERPTASVFRGEPATAPLSPKAQAAADQLVRVASAVLGPGGIADRFCLAHADLALALHRLIANGDPVPEPLRAWAARVWERPSIRRYVAIPR